VPVVESSRPERAIAEVLELVEASGDRRSTPVR